MKIFSNIIIIIFGPENIGLWIAIQENFSNDKKKRTTHLSTASNHVL
jgi:hypothetical protein